jgi:hypothetical protein
MCGNGSVGTGAFARPAERSEALEWFMANNSKHAGLGIALGAALGAVLGVMAGRVAIWLGIGVAIGMVLGRDGSPRGTKVPRVRSDPSEA